MLRPSARKAATPTTRRRQRSSSRAVVPALASPSISSRSTWLRTSAGNASSLDPSAWPGSNRNGSRVNRRPSAAEPRTMIVSSPSVAKRRTRTCNPPASTLGASIRRGRRVGASSATVSGPKRARRSASAAAFPSSKLSASHQVSTPSGGVIFPSRSSAARRSTGQGSGANAFTRWRIVAASVNGCGSAGAAPTCGAVVTSATLRFFCSAWSSSMSSARSRAVQSRAAAQPSSTTRRSGPLPESELPGLSSGRASPTIRSPAIANRRSSSHHGVRAGVSSSCFSPIRRRSAGKRTRRGAGGVARSSHHSAGKAIRAARSQGALKASGPSDHMG